MTQIKKITEDWVLAFAWHFRTLVVVVTVLLLRLVKPLKTINLVIIRNERFGHLAGDTDLFLRRLQLDNKQKNGILYIGLSGKPANNQLLKMFGRKFPIIQNKFIHDTFLIKHNQSAFLKNSGFCIRTPGCQSNEYYELNHAGPTLSFTNSEEKKGKDLLEKMAINNGAWFACFHSRDPYYLDTYHKYFTRERWSEHDCRDCDVDNYVEAAKYIASSGGFAIRIGYGVAKKLPDLNNPRIIDYATYYRTDFGDMYLPAKCKFFLVSHSGISYISTMFHVPVAMTNAQSLTRNLVRKGDLYIPKKMWSNNKKRFLTFREILGSEVVNYFTTQEFVKAELEVVENTPEEILGLAREMNERLDGSFRYSEEDEELQKRFQSLFQPHHSCYGSPVRIGADFLLQNRELLG